MLVSWLSAEYVITVYTCSSAYPLPPAAHIVLSYCRSSFYSIRAFRVKTLRSQDIRSNILWRKSFEIKRKRKIPPFYLKNTWDILKIVEEEHSNRLPLRNRSIPLTFRNVGNVQPIKRRFASTLNDNENRSRWPGYIKKHAEKRNNNLSSRCHFTPCVERLRLYPGSSIALEFHLGFKYLLA